VICQRAKELMPDYLEGCLKGVQHLEMRHHLEGCAGCRGELGVHQRVLALVKVSEALEPPPGLWNGVRNRIGRPEPRANFVRRWFGTTFSKPLNAASALAALAALGAMLLSSSPTSQPPVWQPPGVAVQNVSAAGFLQQQTVQDAREPLADRVALGPVVTIAVREDLAHDREAGGDQ
jgi:predicted anti-sigma-YlaC factor YlaD